MQYNKTFVFNIASRKEKKTMRYTIKTKKPKRQYLSNEKQKIQPERKTEKKHTHQKHWKDDHFSHR